MYKIYPQRKCCSLKQSNGQSTFRVRTKAHLNQEMPVCTYYTLCKICFRWHVSQEGIYIWVRYSSNTKNEWQTQWRQKCVLVYVGARRPCLYKILKVCLLHIFFFKMAKQSFKYLSFRSKSARYRSQVDFQMYRVHFNIILAVFFFISSTCMRRGTI